MNKVGKRREYIGQGEKEKGVYWIRGENGVHWINGKEKELYWIREGGKEKRAYWIREGDRSILDKGGRKGKESILDKEGGKGKKVYGIRREGRIRGEGRRREYIG